MSMNPRSPDEIPEYYNAEEMSRVVRSLAEAGWLVGDCLVGPVGVNLHYSEKGISRMRGLSNLVKPYFPKFFGLSPNTPNPDDDAESIAAIYAKVFLGALTIAPDLASMSFSERESKAFIGLVFFFGLQNQGMDGKRAW